MRILLFEWELFAFIHGKRLSGFGLFIDRSEALRPSYTTFFFNPPSVSFFL